MTTTTNNNIFGQSRLSSQNQNQGNGMFNSNANNTNSGNNMNKVNNMGGDWFGNNQHQK
jgi:hypothetical protein